VSATTLSRKHIDPETWYTSAEAAEILGTSTRGVQRASRKGDLKAAEINDRHDRRHLGRWLLDWLESGGIRRDELAKVG
jgi:hypothetical protein